MRRRLDAELVRRGLAPNRQEARFLVEQGAVLVGGALAQKVHRLVDGSEPIVVSDLDSADKRFVSRGGIKLASALDRFGIDVTAKRCLDAGASTGGFTDSLLQHGAAHVVAVDVGFGQLAQSLRSDPRVTVLERTNVRNLGLQNVGGSPLEVVVADLSFISVSLVSPVLLGELAADGADVVFLVKPQFEAGRREAAKGRGVIKDRSIRRDAIRRASSAIEGSLATIIGLMASPVLGPAGNAEYLLYARAHSRAGDGDVDAMIEKALDESPDAMDMT